MALLTSLVTAVVLLSLAVTFLYFLERDYRFAGQQEKTQEAYYLAMAGLRFTATRTDLMVPGTMITRMAIPTNSLTDFVDITVDMTGKIISRGYVTTSSGLLVAQRTLVVAPNSPIRMYQDQSL